MKNKDKYKLTNLRVSTLLKSSTTDYGMAKHWKIEIFEDGRKVDTKYCEGGGFSDLLAWLESEEEC